MGEHHSVKRNEGFTLVELVVVLVLLLIVTAVISNSLSEYGTIKLNSAARKLASDLEFARQLAASNQKRSAVVLSGSGYSVYEDYDAVPSVMARDPVGGGSFVVDYTSSRYIDFAGVTLANSFPPGVMKFNSLGIPLDTTNTAFAAQQTVTAVLGAQTATVCITPDTGKVRLC